MQLSTLILISLQYLTFEVLFCFLLCSWREGLGEFIIYNGEESSNYENRPLQQPHLDGPLPPGEGDLGSLRPLGAPQLVLVVDDLHDDQADAAHDARAHQYEHLQVLIFSVCLWREMLFVFLVSVFLV